MGLLQVGVGALSSVLADQWREYFYCPSMDVNVLVKKGENRKSNRSFNTKGSSNIISNGSIIAVNEGQCMIIVEHRRENLSLTNQPSPASFMEDWVKA